MYNDMEKDEKDRTRNQQNTWILNIPILIWSHVCFFLELMYYLYFCLVVIFIKASSTSSSSSSSTGTCAISLLVSCRPNSRYEQRQISDCHEKRKRYVCVNHQLICLKVSPVCIEDQDDQIVDTIDWFTDTHSPVNLINKYWMISCLDVWRVQVMDWHDMRGWGNVLRCKSTSTNTRRSKVLNKPQLSKQNCVLIV